MRTIERIYQVLINNASKKMTTTEIAQKVGLTRGDVSSYLTKLFMAGKIDKTGTRPFYWQIKIQDSFFKKMIGYSGSLQEVTKKCREAILYPDNGLSLLITGPSGVGKSFLARLIFEEARRLKVIEKDAKFVVLNAADYANNPEILSSVLFGYKKGAFTGADCDSQGLIDQANGGYLFLDEVHRLNNESQEKLFSLMDNGKFYPLGENKVPHKVKVRFLFATSEEINTILLKTFLRRIPIQIALPKYIDRPIIERLQIVIQTFKREAQIVHRRLKVNQKEVLSLLYEDKHGNIGSVQNKIKQLCAEAFALNPNKNPLLIGTNSEAIISISSDLDDSEFNKSVLNLIPKITQLTNKLLESVEQAQSLEEQNFIIDDTLHDFLKLLPDADDSSLKKSFKSLLCNHYGLKISPEEINWKKCAKLIQVIMLVEDRLDKEQKLLLQRLQAKYPRSFYLFKKLVQEVLKERNLKDCVGILFFPIFGPLVAHLEDIQYNAILLAHGKQTATSIQAVVNSLCGNYIFEAFDMPIDSSIQEINEQVRRYLDQQSKNVVGTIVLFDMGSLNQMFTEIKSISSHELLVINNITTAMALDIGIRIEQKQQFKKIAEASTHYGQTTGAQYYEGFSDQKNIIVACMSGDGVSQEIKHIMNQTLSGRLKIIIVDYKKLCRLLEQQDRLFFSNTEFVLTTTQINHQIPIEIIDIYDVLDKKGALRLTGLLENSGEKLPQIKNMIDQFVRFFSIAGIRERLQILNPDTVISEVQTIAKRYETYYNIELDEKTKLNLFTHIALMIERTVLTSRKNTERIEIKTLDNKEREFFSISKNIFKNVERKYNIKIEDYEISLVYQLLLPNI